LCVQVLTPGKGEVVEVSTKTGSFQASVAAEVLSGLTFREVCHAPLAHTLPSPLLPCWSSCPALLLMTLLPLPRSLVLVVVQPRVVGVAVMCRSALAKPPSWMVCGRRPRRCRCCASSRVRASTDRLVNDVLPCAMLCSMCSARCVVFCDAVSSCAPSPEPVPSRCGGLARRC
jgi:hypothetical protein